MRTTRAAKTASAGSTTAAERRSRLFGRRPSSPTRLVGTRRRFAKRAAIVAVGFALAAVVATAHIWTAAVQLRRAPLLTVVATQTTADFRGTSHVLDASAPVAALHQLGPPPTPISVSYSLDAGSHVLLFLYETNSPLRILAFERRSRQWSEVEIPDAQLTYGAAVDRKEPHVVWVTTCIGAGVYRLDLRTMSCEVVARPAGESHVFSISQHHDGSVYYGTYPGGRCFRAAKSAGAASWTSAEVPVDRGLITGRPYLHGVFAADNDLILHYACPARLVRHHLATGTAELLFDSPASFISFQADGTHLRCNDTVRQMTFDRRGAAVDDAPSPPPATFVLRYDGTRGVLDVDGREHEFSLLPRRSGMSVTCLERGPDGLIYGGTYWNTWAFVIDPKQPAMRGLGALPAGCGEFFAAGFRAGKLMIPNYQGRLYELSLDPPPKPVGGLAACEPARVVPKAHFGTSCLADADGDFLYAINPNYEQRGGMLVVVRSDDSLVTHERIGDDLTLGCLMRHEGRLFAGTLDRIGLGLAEEREQTPKLVEFDKQDGRIVQELLLGSRHADVVSVTAVDRDRLLCATSDRRLVLVDVASVPWRITQSVGLRYYAKAVLAVLPYGDRPHERLVVMNTALVKFNLDDGSTAVVARLPRGMKCVATSPAGDLLLASQSGVDLLTAASLRTLWEGAE